MHRLDRALLHPSADCTEAGVNLSWWRAEDEGDNGVAGDFDVLEGAHDVDFTG